MNKKNFYQALQKEMDNLKKSKVSKLEEKIIEGFTHLGIPKAVIGKNKYLIFNSNDYLGLRHHSSLIKAEGEASRKYGTGPGAVRFISGTMKIHKQLEERIAKFHHRDDAIVFS